MATMLEDFRHMDVRGADLANGSKLVYGDAVTNMALGLMNILTSFSLPVSSPSAMLTVYRKVREYNCRWPNISPCEKRDVIAALRMSTKVGIATAKVLIWLA